MTPWPGSLIATRLTLGSAQVADFPYIFLSVPSEPSKNNRKTEPKIDGAGGDGAGKVSSEIVGSLGSERFITRKQSLTSELTCFVAWLIRRQSSRLMGGQP